MSGAERTTGLWVTLLVVVAATGGYSAWSAVHEPAGLAPDFTLTSTGYENGVQGEPVEFSLADYRGQTVLLDLMGVTCASCRILTAQVLEPLQERYGNRTDFVILSVDVWAGQFGESREELIALQEEEGVPWRHALDTDGVLLKYGAFELPKITLIDPEGRIVYDAIGIPPLDRVDAVVRSSFTGEAEAVEVVAVGVLGLALLAGLASAFSPCSVGLLPAYLGFLLTDQSRATAAPTGASAGTPSAAGTGASGRRYGRAIAGGLATAAGIVSVYAVIAVLLWLAGPALRPYVRYLAPTVAVLLVALGLMMLAGFDWNRLVARLGGNQADGRRGFYAFGIGYGTAAFGCTGPIFVPILLAAFVEGTLTGFAAFGLYTAAVAGLVLVAALLVAAGRQGMLRAFLSRTRVINKISAALLVAAGAYLLWFSATSNGLL
ncbi:MAG: hypothetical protein ACPGQL_09005 [Thermoplasmatota archaeon]